MMQYDVKSARVASTGTVVTQQPVRLKCITVTSATSSLRNVAVCDPTVVESGTYSQTTNTITCTITAHGFADGQRVFLDFTTGNSRDGAYTITYVDPDTFTVTAANSISTSGNVSAYSKIDLELDTFSTVGLPVLIPGEGIYLKNGMFVGCGPSVTATVFYG
jgi:hypothetical protein